MSAPSFGAVYNRAQDKYMLDSSVSLSTHPQNGNNATQSVEFMYGLYLSDDASLREFAVWGGTNLKTYSVSATGTPEITLLTTTTTSGYSWSTYQTLGLIRKSDTSYYLYYYKPSTLEIRRISFVLGTSYSDDLIQTLDSGNIDYWLIGTVWYFSILITSTNSFTVDVYSFDLDTETFSSYDSYDASGSASSRRIAADVTPIAFIVANSGTPIWMTAFYEINASSYNAKVYIVVDGTETEVYSETDTSSPYTVPDVRATTINRAQYNSRDYFFQFLITSATAGNQYVTYNSSGTWSLIAYADYTGWNDSFFTFISDSHYPGLTMVAGDGFYWVNPSTGERGDKFDNPYISSMSDIYAFFPTLDAITGDMYISANYGGYHRLLAIPPGTSSAVRQIHLSTNNPASQRGANHGYFLALNKSGSPQVIYIAPLRGGANVIIPEMN